ncbi:MAG: 4-alpha-glucanotransferase [Thalassotalea sp.]|nr:4-alpha-glucanotransferase [Thalassotalea sp.]
MSDLTAQIRELSSLLGFHANYTNAFGDFVEADVDALAALLSAMGYQTNSEQALANHISGIKQASFRKLLPDVHIVSEEGGYPTIVVSIPSDVSDNFTWHITTEGMEDNKELSGECWVSDLAHVEYARFSEEQFNKFSLPLPTLKAGYHHIAIKHGDQSDSCQLIVAPNTCYQPHQVSSDKLWGFAAQLYSLTSERNWGMGDFSDLNTLIADSAAQGASAIGLNPLHPLFQHNPYHFSPYSPSSRCLLNPLYIDVESVDGFEHCQAAQQLLASEQFKTTKLHAQNSELIDYPAVAALKYPVLELLYEQFCQTGNEASAEFEQFKQAQDKALISHATYEALYEFFRKQNHDNYGWQTWPEAYQKLEGEAVRAFQEEHSKRIDYFCYLQWLAHLQLSSAQALCQQHDMPIGLYLDLAVGCDGSGAEVWANQALYVSSASIGAPPDAMNTLGQNWGLTPMNPSVLRKQAYHPFIQALRSAMRYAGAIRIDHILGLLRQYWVAPGFAAHQGIYISFPFDELLSIIALESQRNKCLVVGEDLGTVPEGFSEQIQNRGLLSYKVLYFEKWQSGLFKRPDTYPEMSMVTVSTHDLPTLYGWWQGEDLTLKRQLALYPNEAMERWEATTRSTDRYNLIAALTDMALIDNIDAITKQLDEDAQLDTNRESSCALDKNMAIASQAFLAKSPCFLQLIPLEDALALTEQVNMPGTVNEHPNWRRKLPLSTDVIMDQDNVQYLNSTMRDCRPKQG